MKLTYVTQHYPPHIGGLELVALRQAHSAVAAGHDVSVVTYRVANTRLGCANESGVSVHRVRGWHFFDTYLHIPYVFGGVGMIRTVCREVKRADVVHLHDVFYMTSLVAYLASRFYKRPLVLSQHVALVQHSSALVMFMQKVVYALWGYRIMRASRRIVAYQKVVYDFLMHSGIPPARLLSVHNGINIQNYGQPADQTEKQRLRKEFGLPADRPLVLFVGRLVPKKGYRELFEARDSSYDLVFVGPGSVPKSWHTTEGVHVLGPRSEDELRQLYSVVDAFAAPSRGEMFTLVMQEAFASGLPVVMTDAPEYESYALNRELVSLCEPTPSALKRELTRIMSDTALRERMGTYSRTLAEQYFNWDTNVQQVLDLYGRLERERVVVTTSWDDGHSDDVRLSELLKKYGIQGTFYVAPHNHEFSEDKRLTPESIRTLSHTFEVGAHTMTHRHLTTVSNAEARGEIEDSKRALCDILNEPVTSFCYPAGKYHASHTAMVRDAGYTYARTVQRFSCTHPHSLFEAGTTIHTYDHWLDVWGLLRSVRFNLIRFVRLYRKWDEQAIALFDHVHQYGGVFHLWGHSWELAGRDGWNRLERVLKHIARRSDVAYVQNRDLV